jgi:CRP-like cAMP-binding protein
MATSLRRQKRRDDEKMSHDETARYPCTGRFLMGRLRHAMSDEEKAFVEDMIEGTTDFNTGDRVLSRGQLCDRSTILVDGFMLRTIFAEENRHVVGVQVPGDFVDLHAFALKRLDHDIVTVGPARVGFVSHKKLEEVMRTEPHLARLLWFSTLLDAAIHREWIMKLEQLRALRRVAHIFCELWKRLEYVGMGRPDGIMTPLIQSDLADMCGTTAIHMNRALGTLRKEGIADFQRGHVTTKDRAKLEEYADFDPSYLYGEGVLGVGEELTER